MQTEATTETAPLIRPIIDPSPPAPAAEEKTADTGAQADDNAQTETDETTEQAEQRKHQSKFQRRLERFKTRAIQAETREKLILESNARLEEQLKQRQQPQSGKPQRDEYGDYEQYTEELSAYTGKQAAIATLKAEREAEQSRREQEQGRQRESENAKLALEWEDREEVFEEATEDYDKVVRPFVNNRIKYLSDEARREIIQSEVGPQLLYHLAKNRDVAYDIADLSPGEQKDAVAKLALKLKTPAAKLVTGAPEPLKPVPQGRSTPGGYRDSMSQDEYHAWKKRQLKQG